MARRPTFAAPPPDETRDEAQLRRAWRHRRKGDERRAMVMLREAAHENEHDARLWVMYGVQCARIGRPNDARRALQHAAWVRERNGEHAKANVTRAIMADLVGNEAA
jgi:Flp pilus assembly protein TadD